MLSGIMLSEIMLIVIMLSVLLVSVLILSVVMLSVDNIWPCSHLLNIFRLQLVNRCPTARKKVSAAPLDEML